MATTSFPQKPLSNSEKTKRETSLQRPELKKKAKPMPRPQELVDWEQSDKRVRAHRFGS